MAKRAPGHPLENRFLRALSLAAFSLGLVALLSTPASATIYQWFDKDGNAGFTDDLSKVPAQYRDSSTAMSEAELARRVPIHRVPPVDLDPIIIPGYAQSSRVIRGRPQRFEPPPHLRWSERSVRQVYVPNLGFLAEDSSHGPSEHTGHERAVYIDGHRFFLKNPNPIEGNINWADKETLLRLYGPSVREPELDLYLGGHP
jgi:hypothetical protein